MSPYRPTQIQSFLGSLGVLIASLSAMGCSDDSPIIYENRGTSGAFVYGQVRGGNPPAAGWRVSIAVYSSICGQGLLYGMEVAVQASGSFLFHPDLPVRPGTRCITATLLPIIGSDTVRNSGTVYFSETPLSRVAKDSIRLDLQATSP